MQMKYLSPSRLSRFAQCELSFYFKYVAPQTYEDETTEWYGSYGSLLHEILEKLAKREIVLWQAINIYNENFPFCHVPEEQRINYYPAGLVALERKSIELYELRDQILGVEQEFNIMFDFSIPPLHGYIDLIYKDEFGLVVRDYKSSRVYDGSLMKKQLQPFVYAIACKHLFGEYPYKFQFDFIRFDETKSVLIDDNFIKMGEIKVKNYWNKIGKSQFPAAYSPFYCKHFCEFKSLCPTFQLKLNR